MPADPVLSRWDEVHQAAYCQQCGHHAPAHFPHCPATPRRNPDMNEDLATVTDLFGPAISICTVSDLVEDGSMIRLDRKLGHEAGIHIPVVLTSAAHATVIEWTRDDWDQHETGRTWDVLNVLRAASRRQVKTADESGTRYTFAVAVVPNRTPSGALSRAVEPRLVRLVFVVQGWDMLGDPCFTIMLPEED